MVKPALQRLGDFRSAAVKLQLMNVCRAPVAGDEFYRLLSLEDTRRTTCSYPPVAAGIGGDGRDPGHGRRLHHRCMRRIRISSLAFRRPPDTGLKRLSGSSRQRTGRRLISYPDRAASSRISTSNM